MAALFACTKCNGRYPFDELTKEEQLCKALLSLLFGCELRSLGLFYSMDCRGVLSNVKCTYCRTEFQQEVKSKSSTVTICKKCEQNVKLYGKPTACEYCNIIAAFIGAKCQRCTNSEKKYGSALTCDQCKQRCAFDRKDDTKKKVMVDGKLLCWLCTLSYKRALAKAKQNQESRNNSKTNTSSSSSSTHHRSHKHPHKSSDHSLNKKPRLDKSSNGVLPNSGSGENVISDANSTDHMVALTQLKEQIASLQKQLNQKDQQLLAKDKVISEFKAKQFSAEKEMRTKVQALQKSHSDTVQELQVKVRELQKKVATLSKGSKRSINTDSPSLST